MDDFDRKMKRIMDRLGAEARGEDPRPVASSRTLFGIRSSVEEQMNSIAAEQETREREKRERLEAEMQELGAAIERDPYAWAGHWRNWHSASEKDPDDWRNAHTVDEHKADHCKDADAAGMPEIACQRDAKDTCECETGRFGKIVVDFGSGMGDYLVALGARDSGTLFIGVEKEDFCVVKSADKALRARLSNVVFVPSRGLDIAHMFGVAEVNELHVNFPTPHPRARDAYMRMTHLDYLAKYRSFLASDGMLSLKTDSKPFFDFTLTQLDIAGYAVTWTCDDLHEVRPDDPCTGYETRTCERGAKIFALEAQAGDEPAQMKQTALLSLYDYLPEDWGELEYVPLDMEKSVKRAVEAEREVEARRERKEHLDF